MEIFIMHACRWCNKLMRERNPTCVLILMNIHEDTGEEAKWRTPGCRQGRSKLIQTFINSFLSLISLHRRGCGTMITVYLCMHAYMCALTGWAAQSYLYANQNEKQIIRGLTWLISDFLLFFSLFRWWQGQVHCKD